ncbi:MAG: hypothetical protein O2877_01330 [bacterium]|nr:hypothetical protein [bacterium]
MIYVSIGIAISVFGAIFLFIGIKQRWREMINGSIAITAVGIFIFIVSLVALASIKA